MSTSSGRVKVDIKEIRDNVRAQQEAAQEQANKAGHNAACWRKKG